MNTPNQKTLKETWRRWIPICVATLFIAISYAAWARSDGEAVSGRIPQKKQAVAVMQLPKSVSLEAVTAETVCPKVVYPGIVQAFETTKLAFRVGGPLVEINVKPGDRVKKGDVLIQIDPRDFVSEVESTKAKIQAAKSRLTAMKTGARPEDIKLLEAALQSAQSKTRFCDSEYRRIHTLYEQKVVSDTEHEQAYDNMVAAQMEPYAAVVEASVSRIRPVTMAAGTTVLGMLPLMWHPFYASTGATIAGGLVCATALTLLVVPLFYTILYRIYPMK